MIGRGDDMTRGKCMRTVTACWALIATAACFAVSARAESVIAVGGLQAPRVGHTATLLADGRVLLVGGQYAASGEIYDPSTRAFHLTTSPNISERYLHAAALLPNGQVLVVGGTDGRGALLRAAERYDPVNDRWHTVAPLLFGRIAPKATSLADGRVVVSGGYPYEAEIYDPTTDAWSMAGAMLTHRMQGGATRLPDGRVLHVGGKGDGPFEYNVTAEVYDPRLNGWTFTAAMQLARVDDPIALGDGRVMMAGSGGAVANAAAEAYDPRTGTWSAIAPLPAPRLAYAASRLRNGDGLVAGGNALQYVQTATDTVFVYEVAFNRWRAAGTLTSSRSGATATLLNTGEVLIAGGSDPDGPLMTADLYVPDEVVLRAMPTLSTTSILALIVVLGISGFAYRSGAGATK